MKKLLLSTLLLSSFTWAEGSLFDLKVGGGNIDYDVPIANAGDSSGDVVFDFPTQTADYRWIELEHGIPLVPNIRLESSNLFSEGRATGSGSFNGFPLTVSTASTLNLNNQDLIVYWEVPFMDFTDNVDFDFGLGAKQFDGNVFIQGVTDDPITSLAPYLYTRIHVGSEDGDGLGLEGSLKYATDGVATFYEYVLKAEYTFSIPLPMMDLSVGVEGGIRSMLIDAQTSDSVDYAYFKYSGSFFGFVGKFGI